MAICVYQSNSTTFRTTQVSPETCVEDYRVVTSLEYQEYLTLKGQVISGPAEFDAAVAGSLWGFFFTTTIVFWLIAKKCGLVLSAVRRF